MQTVISLIQEKLQKYPHVAYTTTEAFLEVPAQAPTGFGVWIQARKDGCTVGFEGWHEEFTDDYAAMDCFAFGLSTACRLRVFRCRGTDYKWQVLHQVEERWVVDSEVGSIFHFTWFQPKEQRELQNEIIRPD